MRFPVLPALICLIFAGLAAEASAPAEAPPRAVTDGAGRQVALPASPSRLVSLAPSVSEMIAALGAGDRLVGVSDFCRIPDGTRAPARVGGLVNPDLERIVSLEPDLVVATTSGNYLEDADRVTRLGIPVYTVHTPTVESVLSSLRDLGAILGRGKEGEDLAASLRRRLDAIRARIGGSHPPRTLFVVWGEPILAPGQGSFLDDALALSGADSISRTSPSRWAEIGLEQIVAAAPEVILTVPDNEPFVRGLAGDPRWRTVPAVAAGRVHVVSNAIQQPGPGIVDGIEEVAALLHPR